jgi:hypothetical protein
MKNLALVLTVVLILVSACKKKQDSTYVPNGGHGTSPGQPAPGYGFKYTAGDSTYSYSTMDELNIIVGPNLLEGDFYYGLNLLPVLKLSYQYTQVYPYYVTDADVKALAGKKVLLDSAQFPQVSLQVANDSLYYTYGNDTTSWVQIDSMKYKGLADSTGGNVIAKYDAWGRFDVHFPRQGKYQHISNGYFYEPMFVRKQQ